MLEKGVDALDYKAIILDEVHERSVESDLVIVCVKQFLLRNKNLRCNSCIFPLHMNFICFHAIPMQTLPNFLALNLMESQY